MKTLARKVPGQKPGVAKEIEYGTEMTEEFAAFIKSEHGKEAQCKVFGTLMQDAIEKNWIKYTDSIDFVHHHKEMDLKSSDVRNAIHALLHFGLIEIHRMWTKGGGRSRGSFSQHIKITAKGFERWNQKQSTPQP